MEEMERAEEEERKRAEEEEKKRAEAHQDCIAIKMWDDYQAILRERQ